MTIGSYRHDPDDNTYWGKSWEGSDDPLLHQIDNPYHAFIYWGKRKPGLIRSSGVNSPYTPLWTGVPLDVPEPSGLRLAILADIAEQIRGHGLDVGNTIGEGRQTVGMALGALKSLSSAARALKRGNVEGALRSLGAGSPKKKLDTTSISSTWLGLQYGWLPLLSDVYEVATNWENVTSPPRKFQFRKRKRDLRITRQWLDHQEWRFFRRYSLEANVIVNEAVSTPRSLGLLDPLGVAWELVPWSFAVDWFLPIGSYLDTLNTFQGVSATVQWTSHETGNKQILRREPLSDGVTNGVLEQATLYENTLNIRRSSRLAVEVPIPKVRSFGDAMSPHRFANAVALARQMFK